MSPENMPLFYMCDLSKNHSRGTSALRFFYPGIGWLHRGLEVTSVFQTKRERKIKLHVQTYSEK